MAYTDNTTSTQNMVFRKIKEISARGMQPRPMVTTTEIAGELSMALDNLQQHLAHLQQLRLVSFCDSRETSIRLTLLGSVVKRDK